MFSANENILLRKHKRRIVQCVEECIPESVLDAGTSVMAMQMTCNSPGCVPLETAIVVVFPRNHKLGDVGKSLAPMLIDGLEESRGGTFKTKIPLPMSDVTKEDILDALPPQFLGGKRTVERLCRKVRDVSFGQIMQLMGEEDVEGRGLVAGYLVEALQEYVARGCIAPDAGEPFPLLEGQIEGEDNESGDAGVSQEKETSEPIVVVSETKINANVKKAMSDGGNFVFRRASSDDNKIDDKKSVAAAPKNENGGKTSHLGANGTFSGSKIATKTPHPASKLSINVNRNQRLGINSSQSIIQQLTRREHAPGIRKPACPCCDPDDPSNVLDTMMML